MIEDLIKSNDDCRDEKLKNKVALNKCENLNLKLKLIDNKIKVCLYKLYYKFISLTK